MSAPVCPAAGLSPVEQAVVRALVAALVRDIRSEASVQNTSPTVGAVRARDVEQMGGEVPNDETVHHTTI